MKLWKIMTSRIEFITRGVKIMARSLTKPLKKNLKKPLTKKLSGSTTGSKKRVQQRRQTAADRLKKPLKKSLTKPLTKSLNRRGSQTRVNQRKKTVLSPAAQKRNPTATKNITAKKTTPRKLPGGVGKAITLGTLLTTGAISMMKKKDPTFGEAFRKARKEKGPNSTFNYKGKKYSTVTKDQVKKAGHTTLRSYLNAGGKKKTSVKKPMKRKTGPRNRR